jgi:hypothetical protein
MTREAPTCNRRKYGSIQGEPHHNPQKSVLDCDNRFQDGVPSMTGGSRPGQTSDCNISSPMPIMAREQAMRRPTTTTGSRIAPADVGRMCIRRKIQVCSIRFTSITLHCYLEFLTKKVASRHDNGCRRRLGDERPSLQGRSIPLPSFYSHRLCSPVRCYSSQ